MTSSSDQPDNQALTTLDRDRYQRHIAELAQLSEEDLEGGFSVPDHPSLDDHTLIIDEAHPVLS